MRTHVNGLLMMSATRRGVALSNFLIEIFGSFGISSYICSVNQYDWLSG